MSDVNEGLPIRRRTIAVIAMSAAALMLQIDGLIVSVALPTLAEDLAVDPSSTVLLVTIYQLMLAMTVLPMAALGDRIGHRRLFCCGLVVHTAVAFMYAFADSLPALIFLRGLQSIGAAAVMCVSTALLRNIYPLRKLGAGLALNTVANATGTSLAPVVGGLILSVASWRWTFAAVVPLALITLALSRALPDPKPRPHRFDGLGALYCALTFGMMVGGLESLVHGNHLPLSLAVIAVAIVVAWLFIRHERRVESPVLPIDLLAQPVIALSVISCFTATIASLTLIVSLPFLLQHGYGFSPGEIGGMIAFYAIASLMVAPVAGYLSDRIPVALLGTIGMTVGSVGLLTVAMMPDAPTHFDVAWRVWLVGAGFGMFFSPNARLLVASAPVARAAAAGSLFTTTRMLGQVMGATVVATLLAMDLGDGPWPALVAMMLAIPAAAMSAYSLRNMRQSVSFNGD